MHINKALLALAMGAALAAAQEEDQSRKEVQDARGEDCDEDPNADDRAEQ